jgi:peptidylprolyl isomerase
MSSLRLFILSGILIAGLVLAAGCTQQPAKTANSESNSGNVIVKSVETTSAVPVSTDSWKRTRLETSLGNITIALDPAMTITAGNFEILVQKGYYNGVIFHRVIDGFMIQGGDPTGTGRGGPGYTIQDEYTYHNKNSRGAIAMANTGQPNSGGSQFFINLVDNSALQDSQFDKNYPVFGKVVEGMDIVNKIGKVPTDNNDRPLQNITIIRAEMV